MARPPVFVVDFNELVEPNVVLLSKADQREDKGGQIVTLVEGMRVLVSEEDLNERGERDDLIAAGVVIPNTAGGWTTPARWSCLIDGRGVCHKSDGLHQDEGSS